MNKQEYKFKDPETIVENNFRVLLTRARKEMILLIPNDPLMRLIGISSIWVWISYEDND